MSARSWTPHEAIKLPHHDPRRRADGLVFAATHPDRLRALIVVDGWRARLLADADYPIGLSPSGGRPATGAGDRRDGVVG